MAQTLKDFDEVISDRKFDRRKAKRLFLNFSIEISGVNGKGQPFLERTKTEDISETGCRLFTTISLKCGDLLDIRLAAPEGTKLPEEKAHRFQITWVHPERAGWSIGARKIEAGKIWKVSFPPPRSYS